VSALNAYGCAVHDSVIRSRTAGLLLPCGGGRSAVVLDPTATRGGRAFALRHLGGRHLLGEHGAWLDLLVPDLTLAATAADLFALADLLGIDRVTALGSVEPPRSLRRAFDAVTAAWVPRRRDDRWALLLEVDLM
jgi:hypothetical protein